MSTCILINDSEIYGYDYLQIIWLIKLETGYHNTNGTGLKDFRFTTKSS